MPRRHDDVVHYQRKKADACIATSDGTPGAEAKCILDAKQSDDVCELIIYQSLSHETLSGGDGFTAGTGNSYDDKIDAGHDADGIDNHEFNSFNRYENYSGWSNETRVGLLEDKHHYDFGGRVEFASSVKVTCCADDNSNTAAI